MKREQDVGCLATLEEKVPSDRNYSKLVTSEGSAQRNRGVEDCAVEKSKCRLDQQTQEDKWIRERIGT